MIAKDVPAGQWYSEQVKRIISTGLMTKDKDENFNPHAPVTRAMFATVLDRLIEEGWIVKPK